MKAGSIDHRRRQIRRNIVGLVTTSSVFFAAIIILLQFQHNEQSRRDAIVNDYHLAVSSEATALLGAINATRLWFRNYEVEKGNTDTFMAFSQRDQIDAFSYEIEQIVADVRTIEAQFSDPEFRDISARLEDVHMEAQVELNELRSTGSYPIRTIDDSVELLGAVAHQLQRLHRQAYRRLLLSSREIEGNEQVQLVVLIGALTVLGLVAGASLLRDLSSTLSDLTQTEIELRESEGMLRKAQEIAQVNHWRIDPETTHVTGSTGQPSMFGERTGQVADVYLEVIHPDDRERVRGFIRRALETGESWSSEYRIVLEGGVEKWIQGRGEAVTDAAGEIVELVGTIQDITERKRTEAELTNYREHLEELVEERTRELLEAQEILDRQERLVALGELTATVSHELRNPLGAIRSSVYVIGKGRNDYDARTQRSINRVNENIDRCDHIIEELLDFARVPELALSVTRIDAWLESVIDEQQIPANILVEKDFSTQCGEAAIDGDRLRRAVINVVENACHAMRDGNQSTMAGGRLGIAARGNDERIEIAVSDTGTGMPEQLLKQIFEPFFSTGGFGVGLGMPTVRKIMEQHRGGVEIETEVDHGTTITLWLPRPERSQDDSVLGR